MPRDQEIHCARKVRSYVPLLPADMRLDVPDSSEGLETVTKPGTSAYPQKKNLQNCAGGPDAGTAQFRASRNGAARPLPRASTLAQGPRP